MKNITIKQNPFAGFEEFALTAEEARMVKGGGFTTIGTGEGDGGGGFNLGGGDNGGGGDIETVETAYTCCKILLGGVRGDCYFQGTGATGQQRANSWFSTNQGTCFTYLIGN